MSEANKPPKINGLFQAAMEFQKTFEKQSWQFCFIDALAVIRWGNLRMTQDEAAIQDDRSKIKRITLRVSSDIEVLPYLPQDFNADNPFVKEIMETGISII